MKWKTEDGGWSPYLAGALAGVLAIAGMVVGAALYAELYPLLKSTVLAWKDFGKISVAEVLGISPWLIIPVLWAGILGLFVGFERNKL